MNCSESEKNIYVYNELTAHEREETDHHVKTCASCRRIMERVSILHNVMKSHQSHTPSMTNHAQMTHRIMDALNKVRGKRKSPWYWFAFDLNVNAVRSGMAVLSLLLVVTFIGEFSSESASVQLVKHYPRKPGEKTPLNLASFHAAFLQSKEKNVRSSMLMSECVNNCLQLESSDCEDCANKFAKPF